MRNYLASHPNIFFAVPDEPGYFDRKFRFLHEDDCAYRTLGEYLSLYNGVDPQRHLAVGEGSVYMMYSREILKEILSLSPTAKFIIMLRNPYLAAISMHGENLKSYNLGREPKDKFSEAWADLPYRNVEEIAGIHPMRFRYDLLFSYNKHVEVAREMIGDDNLMFIFYDDFKIDNLGIAKVVYEFLGVDPNFHPRASIVNKRSQSRNNLITKMIAWAAKQSRRYRILRHLRGRGLALNRFTQETLEKPKISVELMADMRKVYQDDIRALQSTLGKDLSIWLDTDLTTSLGQDDSEHA